MTSLPEIPLKKKKANPQKIVFYVGQTKYSVVKYVGLKMLGYKLTENPDDQWDVMWTDSAVTPDQFDKMKLYQKVNHFPGMYSLARKNHLGRHLMKMRAQFPEFYRFFPKTYLLPADYSLFKAEFLQKKNMNKTFIVKPEASCQGRGIYLTRNFEDVDPMDHVVIQNYIDKPFLIDNLKFDLRLYVLLAGCNPLRIYLHNEGLARFATEEYKPPKNMNIDNLCMHLTNYAINKKNKNFVFSKDKNQFSVGHKRSLSSVWDYLKENGHDVEALMKKIEKFIIKMFCSVQPILAHNYASCQPQSYKNDMCFELLGLDVLLDHKLNPYLIEVNHTPSFNTDTPLDKAVKRAIIRDSLLIMDIKKSHKNRYLKDQKLQFEKRAIAGVKTKMTFEEKEKLVQKGIEHRNLYENINLGGFKKLYPVENEEEPYKDFMEHAKILWQKATGTLKKSDNLIKKDENKPEPQILNEKPQKTQLVRKIATVKSPPPTFNRSHSQNSTKASTNITQRLLHGEKGLTRKASNIKILHLNSQQNILRQESPRNTPMIKTGTFIKAKVMEFFK